MWFFLILDNDFLDGVDERSQGFFKLCRVDSHPDRNRGHPVAGSTQ